MEQFTVANPGADLSMPFEAKRGRYWYNLHVVLIVAIKENGIPAAKLNWERPRKWPLDTLLPLPAE